MLYVNVMLVVTYFSLGLIFISIDSIDTSIDFQLSTYMDIQISNTYTL